MTFYICKSCGNLLAYLKKGMCTAKCCGETMEVLEPNSTDAAGEKHVPVVTREGQTVRGRVGEVDHPMTEAHYITWIALETKAGMQRKPLTPDDAPAASFALTEDDSPVAAYAYCNLHGLWKADC